MHKSDVEDLLPPAKEIREELFDMNIPITQLQAQSFRDWMVEWIADEEDEEEDEELEDEEDDEPLDND